MHAEVLDGLALELRRRRSLGVVAQHFASARRLALRQHEQRPLLHLARRRAFEDLLEHRHRLFGGRVLQRLQRHQLDLVVGRVLGTDRLSDVALDLGFQHRRLPAIRAVRIVLGQLPDGCKRLGPLAQPVLRERLPVERGVDLAALQLHHAVEGAQRAVPAVFVGRILALGIPLRLALAFTLAELRFPIAPLGLAVGLVLAEVERQAVDDHLGPRRQHRRFGDRVEHRRLRRLQDAVDLGEVRQAGPIVDRSDFHRADAHRGRGRFGPMSIGSPGPGPDRPWTGRALSLRLRRERRRHQECCECKNGCVIHVSRFPARPHSRLRVRMAECPPMMDRRWLPVSGQERGPACR